MPSDFNLLLWVAAWAALAVFTVIRHWRDHHGAGLVVTYVLSFGALHWMAPAMHLLPWHQSPDPFTEQGLRQSVFAMLAFAIGGEFGLSRHSRREARAGTDEAFRATTVEPRLVNVYLYVGAVVYAVIFPFAGSIPSATAIVSTASTLAIAAIGLKCWNNWQRERWVALGVWLLSTIMLPAITVIGQGFLGYGFGAMLTIFAFVSSFQRLRWYTAILGLVLAYLGMSVYVTYMRDRTEIRNVVWAGAGVGDRFGKLDETIRSSEWFDLSSSDHLDRIDERLNQDFLVGASVAFLGEGQGHQFARGATLMDAAVALIPRAFWPEKPSFAGSGDLVANYTGFRYAEGTSIGIGQLMECYVNFGTVGVLVGFFIIGAAVVYVDRSAGVALRRGDANRFLFFYLPGLSLLNVGGLFAEVTSTGAAALVVVIVVAQATARMQRNRRPEEPVAPVTPVGPIVKTPPRPEAAS